MLFFKIIFIREIYSEIKNIKYVVILKRFCYSLKSSIILKKNFKKGKNDQSVKSKNLINYLLNSGNVMLQFHTYISQIKKLQLSRVA